MKKVTDFLDSHGIKYIFHEHAPVFTCEEAEEHCKTVPGIAGKNLLLRDKNGKKYFLVVLPAFKRIDLKAFAKMVETPKVSFASDEALDEKLGLKPGSVSPFGLINDPENTITLYIDSEIHNAEIVNFHPNDNHASLELTKEMFHKYLENIPHEATILTL